MNGMFALVLRQMIFLDKKGCYSHWKYRYFEEVLERSLKLRCHSRFQRALTACVCVFKVITLAGSNQTLKTQTHAVSARWNRLSQLTFNSSVGRIWIHLCKASNLPCVSIILYQILVKVWKWHFRDTWGTSLGWVGHFLKLAWT